MNTAASIALKYVGQTEKPGNMGFNEAEFEAKMEAVGFQKTHAWCSYFAELVFKEAYKTDPKKWNELDSLFSGSAVTTYKNFEKAGYLINELPAAGNLVIWQMMKAGKPSWQGHAGIVVNVQPAPNHWLFESVEGNTNDGGGREGYIVALKKRKVLREVKDGLKILGFVTI